MEVDSLTQQVLAIRIHVETAANATSHFQVISNAPARRYEIIYLRTCALFHLEIFEGFGWRGQILFYKHILKAS